MTKITMGADYLGIIGKCRKCGSPVSDYLCNPEVENKLPNAVGEDYIAVCDNEQCPHHAGEGYLQDRVSWLDEGRKRRGT